MDYWFWREGLIICVVALVFGYYSLLAFRRGDRSAGRVRLLIAGILFLVGVLVAVTGIRYPR